MENSYNGKKSEGSISIVDLFFYLLSYWYWFVFGVIVCGGIATYRYAKATFVYKADATIMIKDPQDQGAAARLEAYNNLINRVNITNEILEFQSQELMTNVVKRVGADISYKTQIRFRMVELYNSSPIIVHFVDDPGNYFNLALVPKNRVQIVVKHGETQQVACLKDTIMVDGSRLVLEGTPFLTPEYYNKEIFVLKQNPSDVAKVMLGNMTINQIRSNAAMLSFSLRDLSARRACDILQTLFEVYDENAVDRKKQISINTASFINERIVVIDQELSSAEEQLQYYQAQTRTINASEATSNYLKQSNESAEQIEIIDRKIRLANYLREYIEKDLKSNNLILTNTGLDNLHIESLIQEYNQVKAQKDKLLSGSTEENPVIKELNRNLSNLKDDIIANIDNLIDNMIVQRSEFESQETEQFSKFTSMPQTTRRMLSIERKQNIKEQLYMYLLNKREENGLAQALVDNNVRVIDSAESSGQPVAPDHRMSIIFGILLGLIIPSVILFARLFLDTKVRSRKEVESSTSAPFLGEIPLDENKKTIRIPLIGEIAVTDFKNQPRPRDRGSRTRVVYNEDRRSVITEAFRMLCTNIDFMNEDHDKSKVITVSSFMVSSGKSFIILNMAACFADNKKKVIMVDLDTRKRSLSRSLGVAHHTKGISNYLSDNSIQLNDIIKKNIIPGVDIIPAGAVPPNPVELLRRKRLDSMIEELRKEYDCILIDNVPADIVADAIVIDRIVDTTVFVIRSGQIDRRMLPTLDELYHKGKFHNMGIVLNGAEIHGHYGYRYGYGYGYGYGYSYGHGYYGYGYGKAYGEAENKGDKE